MPTNDERREVAAKLRNITDWECDMCFIEEILAACVGDAYVHYSGCQLDYRLMIDGLAELIEPEPECTCLNLGGEEGTNYELYDFGCSSCGYCADITEPNYCPYCGAKVVEK